MHAHSNTRILNPDPRFTNSSNVSSNRIKIQEILLILQLETDYFSKLFISEMLHSKQWYYSLHRDFQNCYSTRRILTRFFKLQFQFQFQLQLYTCTLHYNPENSPSRIQFYIQKTKSSSNTTVQKCIRVSYMTFQLLQLLQRHSRHSSHS